MIGDEKVILNENIETLLKKEKGFFIPDY